MKSKGFTLIELLAVIVILAVIALIATLLIMGQLQSQKKRNERYGIWNIKSRRTICRGKVIASRK